MRLMIINRMLIALIVINLAGLCLAQDFSGGSGTEEDPWQIATPTHLDNVRNYVGPDHSNKHFIQTANINLGVPPWNEGEGWEPIGNSVTDSFSGYYDGNRFSISNLFINRNSGDQALFAYTRDASLKKIILENVNVTGRGSTAGLVANLSSTIIIGCSVSGLVSSGVGEGNVGGLIGRQLGNEGKSIVKNCNSTVNVTSGVRSGDTGGLAGYISTAFVINCRASGDVIGHYGTGGLIGSSGSYVKNCYATGNVLGSSSVGGLIGSSSGIIIDCYARGAVKASLNRAGGLIGSLGGTVINCYSTGIVEGESDVGGLIGTSTESQVLNSCWDFDTSNQPVSNGGNGRTTGQMTYPYNENTYTDWDFENIWVKDISGQVNNGYPYLYWQPVPFPNIAQNPMPPDSVINIPLDLSKLSWDYVEDQRHLIPVGFRVYFDTDDEFGEDEFFWVPYIEEQVEYRCADILPERLASGTTYYWKVVPTTNEPDARRGEYYSPSRKRSFDRSRRMIFAPTRGDAENVPVWSFTTEGTTSIEANDIRPYITQLYSNHPNPFNPETTITYSLKEDTDNLQLIIYNVRGQVVRTLHKGYQEKGIHNIIWDGNDDSGNPVSSGIYLYRMKTDDYEQVNKMTIIK